MKYKKIIIGEFVSRPNRFIANVRINDSIETVHVKNTGRCKELLIHGAKVYLSVAEAESRKTKHDLVAVEKKLDDGILLINMDSQIPNDVAEEWVERCGLFSSKAQIKREVAFGSSRFDLYVTDGERRVFIEVKGVTLEKDGVALFPDAPTERGVKHVTELIRAVDSGFEAYILFVIQMKGIRLFSPNIKMHPEFAEALVQAKSKGVDILAFDCIVTEDSIEIDSPIPINLME